MPSVRPLSASAPPHPQRRSHHARLMACERRPHPRLPPSTWKCEAPRTPHTAPAPHTAVHRTPRTHRGQHTPHMDGEIYRAHKDTLGRSHLSPRSVAPLPLHVVGLFTAHTCVALIPSFAHVGQRKSLCRLHASTLLSFHQSGCHPRESLACGRCHIASVSVRSTRHNPSEMRCDDMRPVPDSLRAQSCVELAHTRGVHTLEF